SDYVHRISDSVTEFFDLQLLAKTLHMQLFSSFSQHVRRSFTNPALVSILEFPALFLGATPRNTPALYSMMNYADLVLGTWYPMGGMHQIVKAMVQIAEENGAEIKLNSEVVKIEVLKDKARKVHTRNETYEADIVVAGSDYHHTEQTLLDAAYRRYDEDYWQSRVMSPSALLFFIGLNKKVPGLLHHNLFFDADFEKHAYEIYTGPRWPKAPLFYACVPSKTDALVAPANGENLFLLMPLAPGLEDTEELRQKYFDVMVARIEKRIGAAIRENIVVNRGYCVNDFEHDYHSFKGNAYGLANTLAQTAVLKPKMKSGKVRNLFYTGQLTVPGPGVPPSIISGLIVAGEIKKQLSMKKI
ncbi:MAG TPA: phytoene desaturase family protein, partial [Chitinophagales bacterium]|nr:phytoene desaturase family protein [Chitinophagales bacterium]